MVKNMLIFMLAGVPTKCGWPAKRGACHVEGEPVLDHDKVLDRRRYRRANLFF
jgi:hypothetical protein